MTLSGHIPILDFRLSEKESSHRTQIFPFILFAPNRKSKMSSYDPIRPRQHIGRNRQTDVLGCRD
jgi:hypothetical protein